MCFCNVVSRWTQLVSFLCKKKIIMDSDLQIQNYKIEVQLKPKLHQLWRIALWLGKLQLSVFLKIVCFVIANLWSNRELRADKKSDVNQTCRQSMFFVNRSLHEDLIHNGCCGTAAPDVCLQAFSLFPLPSFPRDQRAVHSLDLLDLDNIPSLYMQISVRLPSK